jgi:peptidoglycan-associated lipoprotein
MRKTLPCLFTVMCILVLVAGCKKKPEYPFCSNDGDCREGEMCVNGKCVQCVTDEDCPSGIPCVDGVCVEEGEAGAGEGDEDEIAAGSVSSPYEECSVDTIYFDFDSAQLKQAAVKDLKEAAECLLSKGAKDITIVGHCDPRGTEEYNMGLGLERANAIKKFFVNYGIPEEEIKVYSKGEEEAEGYDEESWSKDRKGEIQ